MEIVSEMILLRIILSLGMLTIGCVLDVWKREIHDYLWIAFGGVGFALLIFEPYPIETLFSVLFALIIAPVAFIAWRLGFFGGADAFALIVLAIIAPQITVTENIVTPFTTLSNAAVLFVVPLIVNVTRNGILILRKEKIFEGFDEPIFKKIIASFIGYKAKNPKYGFSIERKEGEQKKIELSLHHSENEEFAKKPNTWITPGLPYLLLITGGFIIQLLFGDIILTGLGFGT
ncbi:MAG: peptidase [Nitrosopumilaceae archaeon]|nr:peptidase [Nitrosopumilaceae archaeon]NIU01984.1 peptidase [Nitrosopumilaceae archaeon]NIU87135.1 peptidase [Nitrosopumilaceae archaeon]NIV64625.1 peptidase [Nitrosopumilaceae archaeon]NIX62585.1 peptidase [Nitrosopumilaceae archaeon]